MAAKLILASKSASRRALMAGAGLAFETVAADIDERATEARLSACNARPPEVAVELAKAKAQAVSEQYPDAYVIGSDQVLSLGTELFHKPLSMGEAGDHIRAMAGKTHHLNCGVAIAFRGEVIWSAISIAAMTMRTISPSFLQTYLDMAGPDILQSVGAYQFEGPGVQLFEKIEGDYFTILGLPMLTLLAGLRELGVIDA
ncbi:Maf-like protein [Rhizobium sp. KVB221]|uniref:Nucleoside triphosphate pyrophosphatase n=1 Tax=Rhizobium setariae TaxID=2801340 RepID=A0A937CQ90_9HYPH|nr:Maf-like protein [Rhizobium setariae]MBL0374154.1 Maf-like protein [Rhizobium setariae]